MWSYVDYVDLDTLMSSVSLKVEGQRMSRRLVGWEYAIVKLLIHVLPSISRHCSVVAHVSSYILRFF